MALKGFEEKPILGWGQDGFNYVFNKYYDPRMYDQEQWFDRAHNAPLDFLVAGGLLGLLSYLALFGSALYMLWLKRNSMAITEKALLTGLFAGYFFQAIFVFDNLVSYIMFFTTLAYVHSRLTGESAGEGKAVRNNEEKVQGYISVFVQDEEYQNYILIPVIVILTAVSIWWVNVPGILANQTLIQALQLVQAGKIPESLSAFKLALSYKSMGDPEIREQLLSYAPSVLKAQGLDQEVKKEFLNLTANEIDNQIALVPEDARYYILMGSFLNSIGSPEQALPYVKKAIELSPQKQAMRFQLIQSLYALNQIDDKTDGTPGALTEAKKAYELEKSFSQARDIYKAVIQKKIEKTPSYKAVGEQIIKDLGAN
jgi:tetratricopeptide (TPR) repeat protein